VIRRKEKERKIKRKKRSESTRRREELYFFMGKVHITPSNYHIIVKVPPKLLIVSMSPLKLPKNINVPLMTKMPFIKLLK